MGIEKQSVQSNRRRPVFGEDQLDLITAFEITVNRKTSLPRCRGIEGETLALVLDGLQIRREVETDFDVGTRNVLPSLNRESKLRIRAGFCPFTEAD